MRNIEELKIIYINKHTKNWDEQTKQKYISNIEEDFNTYLAGYIDAIKEVTNEVLPILEFTKGRLNSEAGIFQLSVNKLIDELIDYKQSHTNY